MTTQKTTHLTLDRILARIGAAGLRLDHMNAVEAGAGNISVSVTADAGELGLACHKHILVRSCHCRLRH
mgnify:CR=1 FL=1